MSNLSLNVMKSACSDEWISQTFSEYLMHCANAKIKLMNDLMETCADETLENLFDETYESAFLLVKQIDNCVLIDIQNDDPDFNPYDLDRHSDLYRSHYYMLTHSPFDDEPIKVALDSLFVTLGYTSMQYDGFYDFHLKEQNLDQIVATSPTYKNTVVDKVTSFLSLEGYNSNTIFTLNNGFVNLKELCIQTVLHTNAKYDDDTISLNAKDSFDVNIEDISLNIRDLWDELKGNTTSTIAWAQGFAASAIEGISDRLSYFDANIKNFANDLGERFTSSAALVKTILSDKANSVKSFVSQAGELLGWSKINLHGDVVNSTDVASYTGASPLSDLNLDTVKGVATATARTIVAVGYGIWEGIKTLASKAWSKIRPYVASVTDNPYDLKEVSSTAKSYTVDSWCYQLTNESMIINTGSLTSEDHDTLIAACNAHKGEWIKISTIFGEILFKINSVVDGGGWIPTSETDPILGLVINYEIQVKPRCMNFDQVVKYLCAAGGGVSTFDKYYPWYNEYTPYSVSDVVESINSFKNSSNLYSDTQMTEDQCFSGFVAGMCCLQNLVSFSYKEIVDELTSLNHFVINEIAYQRPNFISGWESLNGFYGYLSEIITDHNVTDKVSISSVTNLDFLKIVSGYHNYGGADFFDNGVSMQYDSGSDTVSFKNPNWTWHALWAPQFILTMIMVWVDKIENPLDYCYYPYSSDTILFDEPKFIIKTDADNKNVANAFYNAIVLIAVVAIGVLVVGGIVKVAKASKLAKLSRSVGMMDNSMWNGEKLSLFNKLKYQRKKAKIDKLGAATTGLSSGTGVLGSLSDIKSSISSLIANNDSISAPNYASTSVDVVNPAFTTLNDNTMSLNDRLYQAITGSSIYQ